MIPSSSNSSHHQYSLWDPQHILENLVYTAGQLPTNDSINKPKVKFRFDGDFCSLEHTKHLPGLFKMMGFGSKGDSKSVASFKTLINFLQVQDPEHHQLVHDVVKAFSETAWIAHVAKKANPELLAQFNALGKINAERTQGAGGSNTAVFEVVELFDDEVDPVRESYDSKNDSELAQAFGMNTGEPNFKALCEANVNVLVEAGIDFENYRQEVRVLCQELRQAPLFSDDTSQASQGAPALAAKLIYLKYRLRKSNFQVSQDLIHAERKRLEQHYQQQSPGYIPHDIDEKAKQHAIRRALTLPFAGGKLSYCPDNGQACFEIRYDKPNYGTTKILIPRINLDEMCLDAGLYVPNMKSDPTVLEDIKKEIQITQELRQQGVQELVAFKGWNEKRCMLYYEWGGMELFDYLEAVGGRITNEDQQKLLKRQTATAVKRLKDCGYIHADLKPENVVVRFDDNSKPLRARKIVALKLIDFGFAHKPEEKVVKGCGTPGYLAPEIYRGARLSHASEVASTSFLWHSACKGSCFFDAETDTILGKSVAASYKERFKNRKPKDGDFLGQVEYAMAAPNPGDRPTIEEVLQAFDYLGF